MPTHLLILLTLFLFSVAADKEDHRAHGLFNEAPIAISPQAYAFFHPTNAPNTLPTCGSSNCSIPLAASATVKSTPAQESTSAGGSRSMTPGGIAGICLSFVFVCTVGMGAYYMVLKKRWDSQRRAANAEQQQHGPGEV